MQEEILQNLEPIIAPEPVAFWPLQPGWYVVIAILLALLGYGIYRYIQYKKKNAYRKRALQELNNIREQTFKKELIVQVNELLKVTALYGYPRNEVAGLTGLKWLNFLEATETKSKFSQSPGTLLAQASYMSLNKLEVSDEEWQNLVLMSKQWIKSHKS